MAITPIKPIVFPVTWVGDAAIDLGARPILKGLIDQGAFVVIYGPPGSGKSFFTADIAQHIATGQPWRGRKVSQSLVVYVAAEAGKSILKRFVAWRDQKMSEQSKIPLAIITRGPNLLHPVELLNLVDQLKALSAQVGLPIGLVIFDTLSRSIHGGDENKAEDMTMVVAAADTLRDELQAATAYVHHSGKDVTKGARGHSALHAAADLVMLVDGRTATVEKVRDGVAGERFPFSLEPIEVGTDADGDAITTCLLDPTEPAQANKIRKPPRGIAATALTALTEAIEAHGQILPNTSTIPLGVRGVQINQWRDRFRLRYGDDAEATVRAKAFWRAKEQLIISKSIEISDPWVWVQ